MTRKTDKTKRTTGAEFKAALWLARHPGALAAPGAVAASCAHFGYTPTGIAAASVGVGLAGWYRAHPGSFDAYAAPVLRAWRRRWLGEFVGRRWRDLMDACGLYKEHRRTGATLYPRVVRLRCYSPSIDTAYVRLVKGQAVSDFTAKLEHLAESLKVVRVALEHVKPGLLALIIQRNEPFTYPIPAPDMPRDSSEVDPRALYVGEDEFGEDFYQQVDGTHSLNGGATGAGKNSIAAAKLRSMAPMIRDGLVRLWVCDPKQLEFAWLRMLVGPGRYADNPEDCAELLEAFVQDMKKTQARMQRAKVRKVPISKEFPLNYLIVDEIGTLMAYDPARAREITGYLAQITSMGRATHHSVDAYVQEPSKDVVEIRDLFPNRTCLRVTSATHPDMLLGSDARARGAIADQIPAVPETAGIGFYIHERTRTPIRVRFAYTSDAELDELVDFIRSGTQLRAVS
ncbi:FtsK/SpoIIIE domain-containing protein [Crossiella sp. SN42]|uniref:FtsK/SpoIIIE domain-containing protein n=1 Tax=Crossiella sp. SN42 TaxID=2944808 RepID=UPI00207D5B72|nr:FtsK/SpoIIIE domain-containing protein [Crossiella sp. SN42]MCO1577663.1 FtsK/SpoIIIE domain-containing protein [Crossiella sp. SN42]